MALRADDVNLGRDRVLVELFQSGDCRAFEDLYRRYFQRVYRFCLKRVGDPHEAEELAQEAFVRAYTAMPRLGGERRFYPWLSVIASRLCVDTHRRRGRTTPTAHVELGVVDGGQEDVITKVDHEMLAEALDRVTPRHREVLRLREQEGWSYDRIARHLGVGIGTVEALLFRARRALRREFHAIAGPDSRLAGLPVIGWIIRRTFNGRSRLAEFIGQAGPVLAAGAMSVAVVVGGVAGGGGAIASASASKSATVHVVARVNGGDVGRGVDTKTGNAQAPTPEDVNALVKATRPFGGTTPQDADSRSAGMPVRADAGVVVISADPLAVLPTLP